MQPKPLGPEISPLIQRQVESEEEEEEETVQTKAAFGGTSSMIQRQVEPEEEEEETVQTKAAFDGTGSLIQRQVEEDEEETLQAKPIQPPKGSDKFTQPKAPPKGRLKSLKGSGRALPKTLRDFFEPRFGYDFRPVRIHTSPSAANLSQHLKARAFTAGRDLVFGAGQYRPGTTEGRSLIAHELTHVVQQTPRASGRRSGCIHRTKKGAAHAPVMLKASHSYPQIQRRALNAVSICKQSRHLKVPRLYTTGFRYNRRGPGTRAHSLGPFKCESPRYAVKQGSRLLGNSGTISGFRKQLQIQVKGDKRIIEWINNTYLKTVSAATHYTDFIKKLQRFAGVTPAKPGARPTAGVASQTRVFISDVLRQWHLLGKFSPPSGSNPFENWATRFHEQHHQDTILKNPQIKQAATKIKPVKKALLSDPKLTSYHALIRVLPLDRIPEHVYDMSEALQKARIALRDQIRKLRNRGRSYKSFSNLVSRHNRYYSEEQAYRKHKLNLETQLQPLYTRYKQWMEKARIFAMEDLKAYCLSWTAMQEALRFINRCLTSARARSPGKSIRRRP